MENLKCCVRGVAVGDEWGYGSAVFERGLVVSHAPQRKEKSEERTREERMGMSNHVAENT